MCGIAGEMKLDYCKNAGLKERLDLMNMLQAHRGPDGVRTWIHKNEFIGFGHQRLSIIDIETGHQPMTDNANNTINHTHPVTPTT